MNDTDWRERIAKLVRIPQIIVAALVAGCVFFLVVVLLVPGGPGPAAGGDAARPQPVLTWIGLVFVATIAIVRAVVPTVMVRNGRRRIAQGTFQPPQARVKSHQKAQQQLEEMGDAGQLFGLYLIKTIIGAALPEGATFLMLIAFMTERQTLALGVAVALILAVAAHLPTRTGVIHWIEDQLRLVEAERSLER